MKNNTQLASLSPHQQQKSAQLLRLLTQLPHYKNRIAPKSFQPLFSKKNTVCSLMIDNTVRIIKQYPPGLSQNMMKEAAMLQQGALEVSIPTLIEQDHQNHLLILSFIPGENLCDLLNDPQVDSTEKQRLVKLLARWLIGFHQHFKKTDSFQIRGDASLRNFLFTDRIWGVDFEEARVGKPVEDVADCCASLLSTHPMFTPEKYKLCWIFLKEYEKNAPWKIAQVNNEVAYALLLRLQWRPQDEKLFRTEAERIRTQGLYALV